MELLHRLTPGVKVLMALHALVWIIIQPAGPEFFRAVVMDPQAVLAGQIWQPLTYIFAIPDLGILFFVLLALFFFGPAVEGRLGRRRFLTLYLASGIVAALGLLAVSLALGEVGVMAGPVASDLAVLAAFALMAPQAKILLFFVLPVRAVHLLYGVVVFRMLTMWQAQAFLWPVAMEFLGILVAYLMLRRRFPVHLRDLNPVERFKNWRYRQRMRNFTVYQGGKKSDPNQYLH